MAAPSPTPSNALTWRKLSEDFVSTTEFEGETILKVDPAGMSLLAKEAFRDISHFLRSGHLQQLRDILDDEEASKNDRFVALELLRNAQISADGILPMCQDTGTAIVLAKKGRCVWSPGNDDLAISDGIKKTFAEANLRYSQLAPQSMFEEKNTGTNLPAQIDIFHEEGAEYHFLFIAKGGGSANKTFLYQGTPSILREDLLLDFLKPKLTSLGTAACPPYHLAIVVGGTSAEQNLKMVKLASTKYLDDLPTQGNAQGEAIRCPEMESKIHELTRREGIGARFGGKYFCHDVRVIRLPRHGASLPIGIGVSCSADRQALGKITAEGIFLEELEKDPGRFLPETSASVNQEAIKIDLDAGMDGIRAALTKLPVRSRVSLSGTLIVARDLAHAKLREKLRIGEDLPDYFCQYPIYYAGPAKTPEGYASGSFGPTTAGRMDSFVEEFQAAGGSLVMVAKGNRSLAVAQACKKHGGFYLGSVGGAAARLAKECIKKVECVEFQDDGMEAIWKIQVEDFPAFLITDDKGNDFFLGDGAAS